MVGRQAGSRRAVGRRSRRGSGVSQILSGRCRGGVVWPCGGGGGGVAVQLIRFKKRRETKKLGLSSLDFFIKINK